MYAGSPVGAAWVLGLIFAAIVLFVVGVSYTVIYFFFRGEPGPEGDKR
jgi:hypothetical protein